MIFNFLLLRAPTSQHIWPPSDAAFYLIVLAIGYVVNSSEMEKKVRFQSTRRATKNKFENAADFVEPYIGQDMSA